MSRKVAMNARNYENAKKKIINDFLKPCGLITLRTLRL